MQVVNHGTQPLDELMHRMNIKNHVLVEASTEQLTHKNVKNARNGRELTMNIQMKVLNALNAGAGEKKYELKDIFNYKGRSKLKDKE